MLRACHIGDEDPWPRGKLLGPYLQVRQIHCSDVSRISYQIVNFSLDSHLHLSTEDKELKRQGPLHTSAVVSGGDLEI